MGRVLLLALAVLCGAACTDESAALSILEAQGFRNVEITGYEPFACAQSDSTCTGFAATTPTGARVRGVVGCGVGCGKQCTVRFDP